MRYGPIIKPYLTRASLKMQPSGMVAVPFSNRVSLTVLVTAVRGLTNTDS